MLACGYVAFVRECDYSDEEMRAYARAALNQERQPPAAEPGVEHCGSVYHVGDSVDVWALSGTEKAHLETGYKVIDMVRDRKRPFAICVDRGGGWIPSPQFRLTQSEQPSEPVSPAITVYELSRLAGSKALPIMQALNAVGPEVTLNQAVEMEHIARALAARQERQESAAGGSVEDVASKALTIISDYTHSANEFSGRVRVVPHRVAVAQIRAVEAAALSAPQAAPAEPQEWQQYGYVTITLREAEALVAGFGGADCEMTLMVRREGEVQPDKPEDPPSPAGLWAHCTDYPEEGSTFLGPVEVDDSRDGSQEGNQA